MNPLVVGFLTPFVLIALAAVCAIAIGFWQTNRNVAEDVIAAWAGLRITPTELILGYRRNARRGSLAGLSARVENSGTQARSRRAGGNEDRRIHVIIEGPGTAVVRTRKAKSTHNGDAQARQFAAALNMASRQLEKRQTELWDDIDRQQISIEWSRNALHTKR